MPSPKRIVSAALFGLLLTVCTAVSVKADSVYTYTGNRYNVFFGTAKCPSECGISGSFTVSTPLPASSEVPITPLFFSFTDGVGTITSADTTTFEGFTFVTNSSGLITGWNIDLQTVAYAMFSGTNPPGCVGCSVIDASGDHAISQGAQILGDPGTWAMTTTSVPEPSSLMMLGVGLLGLVGLTLKKSL